MLNVLTARPFEESKAEPSQGKVKRSRLSTLKTLAIAVKTTNG
jgi:hypothetical protein